MDKYKTIPFDIKYRPQLESGVYKIICRCSGYVPTIISWNDKTNPNFPLRVDIHQSNNPKTHKEFLYTVKGKESSNPEGQLLTDLLIVTDELELTEAEIYIKRLVKLYSTSGNQVELSDKDVKKIADDLRKLFNKE